MKRTRKKLQELLQNIKYESNCLSCNNFYCDFNNDNNCIDIDFYIDCELNSIDIEVYEDK